MNRSLIQIVPGLPPSIDGIGDYALQLARRLTDGHAIQTTFLIGDPSWSRDHVERFPAYAIRSRTVAALMTALDQLQTASANTDILLHFSPYGYQVRGCPFWLASGLEAWRSGGGLPVHIAFHELDTQSRRPWSSAFWVPPFQRSIIRRVARVGAFRYTNTGKHRSRMRHFGVGAVELIPNFSTLGEPSHNPPFSGRSRSIVVFGRPAQRLWTYERGAVALRKLCRQLRIERIVDIGQPLDLNLSSLFAGIEIILCGRLDSEEVNRWMSTSLASFMYYPVSLLTKSSVFAVSCAHGCLPFVFDDSGKDQDCPGVLKQVDYFLTSTGESERLPAEAEECSRILHINYQNRASAAAAAKIAAHICSHHFSKETLASCLHT